MIDLKTNETQRRPALLGSRPTLPGGYGFYEDGEPIGFLYAFMNTRARLWLRTDLDARRKTLLSALATALLKRGHDPDAFLLGRHPVFGKLRLVP